MNEGMENLMQIEAMGLAGKAIYAIADNDMYEARDALRDAVGHVEEMIRFHAPRTEQFEGVVKRAMEGL